MHLKNSILQRKNFILNNCCNIIYSLTPQKNYLKKIIEKLFDSQKIFNLKIIIYQHAKDYHFDLLKAMQEPLKVTDASIGSEKNIYGKINQIKLCSHILTSLTFSLDFLEEFFVRMNVADRCILFHPSTFIRSVRERCRKIIVMMILICKFQKKFH